MSDWRTAVIRERTPYVHSSASVRDRGNCAWRLVHGSELKVGVATPVAIESNESSGPLPIELGEIAERIGVSDLSSW